MNYAPLSFLKKYWGYEDFRGIQREIIDSITAGRDTLGLMPTGGGKSITFQIPALASEGICIVITPLVALMTDQVSQLRAKGIKATCIHKGLPHEKIVTQLENCILGDYKLLYISPERISSELFQRKLAHMRVSFICVDEAHCVSQWGYDFRPSYLKIREIREMIPHAPLLALTATATPPVIKDIQQQLGFREENVFSMSFERKNLSYIVQRTEDKEKALKRLLMGNEGSVIIYVRSRQHTKEIAETIKKWGYTATYYHAGLEDAEKKNRQDNWQKDKIRIMVATNAFGMGINKPNVRLVVHINAPDSIEAYFQEAGRAGRDGEPAKAVLLYHKKDFKVLRRRCSETFPDKEHIKNIYHEVCCYLQIAIGYGMGIRREFNLIDFCIKFQHAVTEVESSLRLLTRAGYIEYKDSDDNVSMVQIKLTREELYRVLDEDKNTDAILKSLMRRFMGLFARPVPIDEHYLEVDTGLTRQEIYQTLVSLAKRRIITFIPRKDIPHISFTRERVDSNSIRLSKEIYDKRKKVFEEHIESMIDYISEDDVCRNKYLLNYFGEKTKQKCGQCDVCQEYEEAEHPAITLMKKVRWVLTGKEDEKAVEQEEKKEEIKKIIKAQIEKEGSILPFMFDLDDHDPEMVKEAMKELSDDREIIMDESFRIRLNKK